MDFNWIDIFKLYFGIYNCVDRDVVECFCFKLYYAFGWNVLVKKYFSKNILRVYWWIYVCLILHFRKFGMDYKLGCNIIVYWFVTFVVI